jgi:hypothetical protein
MRAFFPLISIVPLLCIALSITGIALITLGLRGRPVFSSPRCRKCDYDLRNMQFLSGEVGNCPECGVSLATPDAVTFGRWRRQPRRIVWGSVLLVLPWFGLVGLFFVMRSRAVVAVGGPTAVASQTTPALLASLPASITTPWTWQELERRLKANQLAQADVDAAFAALAKSLNADRAAGKSRQPLHWSGSFVDAALKAKAASQPQVDALMQAYYDTAPPIQLRKTARAGEPIPIVFNVHEPWDIPGFQRCWAVSDMTVDGAKFTPIDRYNHKEPLKPDQLSGGGPGGEVQAELPSALPPGEHEIAITADVGIVPDNAAFRGIDGRPGTPDKWPATLSRWQTVVKRKITITAKDQSPLKIITDPNRDPFKSTSISVAEALVRPATQGVELAIKWNVDNKVSPVLSYRIWVQAGGQRIDFGTMVVGSYSSGSTIRSIPDRQHLKSLPPDVRSIDITLEPDPKPAEQFTSIEEVWGQPLELKNAALERFDVEPAK